MVRLSSSACSWMWDNLTCWQAANVGEVVVVNCPEFIHDYIGPDEGEQRRQIQSRQNSGSFSLTSVYLPEMGRVSRNCTEYGWSEPFPHYVDVCFLYDNTTKPVRHRRLKVQTEAALTFWSCVGRTCTTHRSKLCTRSGTALLWSP